MKRLAYLLILLTFIWGCAPSTRFFPKNRLSELTTTERLPLKVTVILPYSENFRAVFSKTPYLIERAAKDHSYAHLLRGIRYWRKFKSMLKNGFPFIFKEVNFIYDNKPNLPEGTQLVIVARGVDARLTDFQRNNGAGSSKVKYQLIAKTPSYKTLYNYRAEGSNRFRASVLSDKTSNLMIVVDYEIEYENSIQYALGKSIVEFARAIRKDEIVLTYIKEVYSDSFSASLSTPP